MTVYILTKNGQRWDWSEYQTLAEVATHIEHQRESFIAQGHLWQGGPQVEALGDDDPRVWVYDMEASRYEGRPRFALIVDECGKTLDSAPYVL